MLEEGKQIECSHFPLEKNLDRKWLGFPTSHIPQTLKMPSWGGVEGGVIWDWEGRERTKNLRCLKLIELPILPHLLLSSPTYKGPRLDLDNL